MDQIMSETESNGDDIDELAALKSRIQDLETEVYGYSNDEPSAGQEAVVDVKRSIVFLSNRREDDSVPIEDIWEIAEVLGLSQSIAQQAFEKLRRHGEIYEPAEGEVRTI